jgi:hypothetical protein
MTDDAARIRDDALDVLRDILGWEDVRGWELPPARWQEIAEILETVESAQASGDLDALATAIKQLELLGPKRTPIGSTPTVPPPLPVRERVGRTIHELSGGTGAGT